MSSLAATDRGAIDPDLTQDDGEGPAARRRMLRMVERTARPWQVAFSWLRQRLTMGHVPSQNDHGLMMSEQALSEARAAMGGYYHREQELRVALMQNFPKVLRRVVHPPSPTLPLKQRIAAETEEVFRANASALGLGNSYPTDHLRPSARTLLVHRWGISVVGDVLVLDASPVMTDLPLVEAWTCVGYVRDRPVQETMVPADVLHGRVIRLGAVVRWRKRTAWRELQSRPFRDVVVTMVAEMDRQARARGEP